MKFLSWNLRGFNNPQKEYALKQYIFQEKIDCVLIQETKMSSENFCKLVGFIWLGSTFLHVETKGDLGGIAIVWNPCSMKGVDIWKDKNFLLTDFQTSTKNQSLINIYATNTKAGRKDTYDLLGRIMDDQRDKWVMCMGDFNSPLYK